MKSRLSRSGQLTLAWSGAVVQVLVGAGRSVVCPYVAAMGSTPPNGSLSIGLHIWRGLQAGG